MKSKAIENLTSAQVLINNGQFTTSVHCSYYAVFLYMKYMLAHTDRNPIALEDQDANSGESSHDYIIGKIYERLNTNSKSERRFKESLRLLKKDRVDADYTTRKFSDIESLDCKNLANGLISNLKTFFGNL